jgi:hypothetical protein
MECVGARDLDWHVAGVSVEGAGSMPHVGCRDLYWRGWDFGASMRLWRNGRIRGMDEREVNEMWQKDEGRGGGGEGEGQKRERDRTEWLVVIERAHANATIVVWHIVRIHKVLAHLRTLQGLGSRTSLAHLRTLQGLGFRA